MKLTARNLLLADAIGAFVSALCLGFILPALQELFGVPSSVLRWLALAACLFFIFSSVSYLMPHQQHKTLLKIVATCNLMYCIVTAAAMLIWQETFTLLANIYFLAEIALIVVLVRLEWNAANVKS